MTFFIILIPTVIVGLMKKPAFVATATVLIKQNNYNTSTLGRNFQTPHSLGIQVAILKSQYLAGRVIQNLSENTLRDLEEHAEYTDYQGKFINLIRTTLGKTPIVMNPMQQAAMELRNGRMLFKGIGNGIIQIGGESTDPHVALDLVNGYIESFKDISSHFAVEQQADLDKSLSLQILNAKSILKKSENALLDYQNHAQNNGGKSKKVDVSSYLSEGTEMLAALRKRKSDLLLTETRSHPDVIEVTQEIRQIEKKIGQVHTIEHPVGGQMHVSGAAWESFLESNIKMDKSLLSELEEQLSSARIIADSNLENLIVIDPPVLPIQPEMVKGFKIILLGFMMAIVGSFSVPFLLILLKKPIQGESNLKQLSGVPNFANIPRIAIKYISEKNGVRQPRVDQIAEHEHLWIFQKEFESMFFRLRRTLSVQKGQVLLVTSPSPKDGKSVTSMNLALTMAHMGHRTILLDADVVRGRAQQNLKIRNEFFAEDFLPGTSGSPCQINWNESNLAVVSLSKSKQSFWTEHRESMISKWFEILRFQSDYIIIDSPPILASTDLLSISAMVDGVLIVVRNNVTLEQDFLRVESVLKEHHFEVMWTVLNDSASPHIQYSYEYTNPEVKKGKVSRKEKSKGLAG
ncbi:MAG: tyrosine-protein kinase domain-containing protein [Leptospirales bacterium]